MVCVYVIEFQGDGFISGNMICFRYLYDVCVFW